MPAATVGSASSPRSWSTATARTSPGRTAGFARAGSKKAATCARARRWSHLVGIKVQVEELRRSDAEGGGEGGTEERGGCTLHAAREDPREHN